MNKKDWTGFAGLRSIDSEEILAVTNVLKRKTLYRGDGIYEPVEVNKCEEALKKITGRKYTLLLNSGTSALQAALRALGIREGDEVVISGFGWITDISAIVELGAIPVFAPIQNDLNIDITKISLCITKKTKLILAVHSCGMPIDIEKLCNISKEYNIPVLDDACQAIGSSFNKSPVGSKTSISIFSFQSYKLITSGEGGAVATDDEELYLKMVRYHDGGLDRFAKGICKSSNPVGVGFNLRMSELSAALLFVQLNKLFEIIKKLKNKKNQLLNIFENSKINCDLQNITSIEEGTENYTNLILHLNSKHNALTLFKELEKQGCYVNYLTHDFLHTLIGWEDYLKNNNYKYRNILPLQTLNILNKTLVIQINWQQEKKYLDKINIAIINYIINKET